MSVSVERKRRSGKKNRLSEIQKPRGYERNLEIEDIVGVTDYTNDIMFLVKWQDCSELDLIPAAEVNEKNPEFVISFYESRSPLIKKAMARNIPNVPIIVPIKPEVEEKPVTTEKQALGDQTVEEAASQIAEQVAEETQAQENEESVNNTIEADADVSMKDVSEENPSAKETATTA